MIELQPSDFSKVRTLFAPLAASHMFCAGVLDGLYSGRVFADNVENPASAFLVKDKSWWYLAGNPHNNAFIADLNRALFGRVISGEKGWGGMLFCHPVEWDAQIAAIYAPHTPNVTERLHYIARQPYTGWRDHIPADLDIRFIDEKLEADGVEIEGAAENVVSLRKDAPEPDLKAVGFAAIHNGKIAATSVIDCIVGSGGDIGLFTDPEFRRRGLAYLTAAAVIEYALAHGLDTVHWDCESYNHGSIATAEKLGLTLDHKHRMYVLLLDPALHNINRAGSLMDAGNFDEAEVILRTEIARPDATQRHVAYFLLAQTYVGAGRHNDAIEALRGAAASGWNSVEGMNYDLGALSNHPAWDEIVAAVERNAEKLRAEG
jgi:RimJ/RimL family protein N-acetyltransferase